MSHDAGVFAAVRAKLERAGTQIGPLDTLSAAHLAPLRARAKSRGDNAIEIDRYSEVVQRTADRSSQASA